MQRVRVEFGRGDNARYASHLDIMRSWHRAMRRAGLPLQYSEGFNPRPRMSLAAPLPVGVTSSAELMDIYLNRRIAPLTFLRALQPQCPQGLNVTTAEEVPLSLASLQSLVRGADYSISATPLMDREEVTRAIEKLLEAESIPWEHKRDTGVRQYDLRPLVLGLELGDWDEGEMNVRMRLKMGESGAGRPEQVMAALGLQDAITSIHRTRLTLARK